MNLMTAIPVDNLNFLNPISYTAVFSEKVSFQLNDVESRKNCWYSEYENSHWKIQCHNHFRKTVNVWAEIEENLTGERYFLLRDKLVSEFAVLIPTSREIIYDSSKMANPLSSNWSRELLFIRINEFAK